MFNRVKPEKLEEESSGPDAWLQLVDVEERSLDDYITDLMDAIATDNEDEAALVFETLDSENRIELFRKTFPLRMEESKNNILQGNLMHMIVASAASKVFNCALGYGGCVSLSQSVSDGSTILHVVCWGAFLKPEKEDMFITMFHTIEHELSKDTRRQLLLAEDSQGLRPLELATKLGSYALFLAIAASDALYKKVVHRHGAWRSVVHDMSEYEQPEPKGRREKSPLKFITYVQRSDVDNAAFYASFRSPFLQRWIKGTFAQAKWIFLLWFAIRLAFTAGVLHLLVAVEGHRTVNGTCVISNYVMQNATAPANIVLFVFMQLCQILFFLFDIVDGIHYLVKRRKRNQIYSRPSRAKTHYLVSAAFYRSLQAVYTFSVLLWTAMSVFPALGAIFQNFAFGNTYMYLSMAVLVTWPFLYFLQLVPGIGHLVIAFQRSLATYVSFAALFILMFISFSVGFYVLMQISCVFVSGTYFESVYFTFQVFLNQIDIAQITTRFKDEWMLVHTLFVNISSILLLNFCIAILSQSFNDITQCGDVIQRLQSLHISITIMDRVGFVIRPLRRRLRLADGDGRITYSETVR